MTSRKPKPDTTKLLESILDAIEAVGMDVEDILDRLIDHFDEARFGSWYKQEDEPLR